ncbi:MAG: GC-type dockerin domain-anchored protein [Phycisphaerales bacterium JB052]
MAYSTTMRLGLLGTMMCFITPGATASDYEITWFDSSSIGSESQAIGDYAINGTIGQLASGPTGLTAGYEINGGFWPGIRPTPPCLADLNGDGELNFFDVSAFLVGFADLDPLADFNNDGLFNFFDVSAFLVAFKDGCP